MCAGLQHLKNRYPKHFIEIIMAENTVEEKLDFKKILPIFIIVLIDLMGLTIIIPMMPLYAVSFGADPIALGLLGAMYPAAQFIGAPLLGRLSDKIGRRPVLLLSQIGTLIGFLLLGTANSLWVLYLSRFIDGLSGANISTAQAVISDVTSEKNRTKGMGLIGAAFGIGFIIGPVIAFAGLMLSGDNYHVPAFIAAGFSLCSILLTTFLLDETHPKDGKQVTSHKPAFSIAELFRSLRKPHIGFLLLLLFLQQIAFGGMEQFLSIFTLGTLGVYASLNAIIFVYVGFFIILVQGKMIGIWSRKWGDGRLVKRGLVLLGIGFLMTAMTPHQVIPTYTREAVQHALEHPHTLAGTTPPAHHLAVPLPDDHDKGWLGIGWLLVAIVPMAIGGGILHPGLNSLLTKHSDPQDIGGTLGIASAFYSAANAFAPLITGIVFKFVGFSAPFLLWTLLIAVLYLVARKQIAS